MMGKRLLLHSTFLFLLPLIVAGFGISLPGAIALVALALLWRWAISLSVIAAPAKTPELTESRPIRKIMLQMPGAILFPLFLFM